MNVRALTVFTLAFAIVYGFVNTFVLWRAFGNMFGDGVRDALPWIVVAVIGLVGVLFIWRRKRVAKISWLFLVPAVIAAAIGLSITDPRVSGQAYSCAAVLCTRAFCLVGFAGQIADVRDPVADPHRDSALWNSR